MRLISLVAYFLISSKRSFRSRILCDTNEHRSSLDNEVNKSIKEEIKEIVNMYIKTPSTIPLETVNPTVLLEYSHIITKPGYYEEVMEDKLDECDTLEEIVQLEKVDLFLRKFIQTERKMRARLKLKYLMVGASTGRFEEAIQLLSDSNEIDSSLLLFTKSMIQRQYQRTLGPTAVVDDDEDESLLLGTDGEQVVIILKKVSQRLEAEMKTTSNPNIRHLGKLLQLYPSTDAQQIHMMECFKRIEDLIDFEDFLNDGIDHITNLLAEQAERRDANSERQSNQRADDQSDSQVMSDNDLNEQTDMKIAVKTKKVVVPPEGTLERMKELVYVVKSFKTALLTGLKEDNVFSTVADDYLLWGQKSDSNDLKTDDNSHNVLMQPIDDIEGPNNISTNADFTP